MKVDFTGFECISSRYDTTPGITLSHYNIKKQYL